MKKIILALLIANASLAQEVAPPPPPSIHDIKKKEEEIKKTEQEITIKQEELKPLETKAIQTRNKWENYHQQHDGTETSEAVAATCENYRIAFVNAYNQYKPVLDAIANLQDLKRDQQQMLRQLKLSFINSKLGKLPCASSLGESSSYEEIFNCWKCFFDGACGTYPDVPLVPSTGIKITPNIRSSGTPPVFNNLSEQQRNKYNMNNMKPPPPPPPPPSESEPVIKQVKDYFQNIIKQNTKYNQKRVTSVIAVRG